MSNLTIEALETAIKDIAVLCDKSGTAIAIKPETLIVPGFVIEAIATEHNITRKEAMLLIERVAINAYNLYDK